MQADSLKPDATREQIQHTNALLHFLWTRSMGHFYSSAHLLQLLQTKNTSIMKNHGG